METATRTVVTFQTSKFNTTESRDYFINPGCFGDDCCKWLIAELEADGVKCDATPGQEDFGWYFNFEDALGKYCVVGGYRPDDYDENVPGVWMFWLERQTGFFSSLFGGRDKEIALSAAEALHRVLSRSSDIRNVQWHTKKNFDNNIEDAGAPAP
ncbi:hypothetical protein KF728_12670 [Candidatus Obscuribacterales bacterium]|nr:hypothetical protein [Candidatus Obscuribacterales bacterium]MBX3150996.1 hypothetical protein [Candidatus Obscuribacterales bacterium]